MKTITIYLQSDKDAEVLMDKLQTAKFLEDAVTAYAMDDDISDEALEAFEESLDEYYEQPYSDDNYAAFQEETKEQYNIGVMIRNK
jgi:C-terminal processing protease CtpA/Prc